MKLSCYYREIYITPTEKLGGGHCAYCMDGWPERRGSECDMAHHVGLCGVHCCDYFMTGSNGSISFLEISDMFQTKENFKNRYPEISRAETGTDELFREHIIQECLLKLYGSMLVLCWFANRCPSEASRLRPREYNFFLVVANASKFKDAKMLDGIKRKLNRMQGVASSKHGAPGVIRIADVLSAEKFKEQLESDAVPPS